MAHRNGRAGRSPFPIGRRADAAERRKDGHMSGDFNQSLNDSAPTCPTCLRTRELAGEIWDLHWICDCGVTPIDPKPGTGPTRV